MFTPKRQFTGFSITPTGDAPQSASRATPSYTGKGKSVAFADAPPPPPPTRLLSGGDGDGGDLHNVEDWRRFREVGLLDKASLERRDREALLERVTRLEKELFDYQYSMGLLLIEKKEWTSKHGELQESLLEAHELLKREKTAHLIAVSQVEDREMNLRKTLDHERQCVIELERSIREIREDNERVKEASQTRLADADGLVAGIQYRNLEVQQNLLVADAKLAEASRKSSEIERKLQEVGTRENILKREWTSLNAERDAHEAIVLKHKEDILEREKQLQEGEERIRQCRRSIDEREEKAKNFNRIFSEREKKLAEEQKNVELEARTPREKEEDINKRLADLYAKEKEAESIRSHLERKDRELIALTEKLSTRERVEIQTRLDEYRSALDLKEREFEQGMEVKRKLLEDEMQAKLTDLDQKASKLNHMEAKLKKQEQILDKQAERVKEKEANLETQLKGLEEKEKTLKDEGLSLDMQRRGIASDKESLRSLKDELEKAKAEITREKLELQDEMKMLRVTEAERKKHNHMQMQLKEEIERYTGKNDLLLKEIENLRQDRKKFEEEWEVLDEKRAELTRETQQLAQEKKVVEKLKYSGEEKLKEDKLAAQDYTKKELEALRVEKESFAARMKHEESTLSEEAQNKHNQLLRDFEARQREMENDMRNKQEEMERNLQERERAFKEKVEQENRNINQLNEAVQQELVDMKAERRKLEKEKQNLSLNKQQQLDQLDLQNDIDELGVLSQKLKLQREQLLKEKGQFLKLVELMKNCKNCGDMARDYMLSDRIRELDYKETTPLQELGDQLFEKVASYGTNINSTPGVNDPKSVGSGGRISWLIQKCTPKIFNLSPGKTVQDTAAQNLDQALASTLVDVAENVGRPSVLVETATPAEDTFEGDSGVNDTQQETEQSELKYRQRRSTKKPSDGIHRTRSVKAVVEEAEAFLGREPGNLEPIQEQNKDNKVAIAIEESREDSNLAGKAANKVPPRKRTRQQSSRMTGGEDADDTEGQSESVATSSRRKRHQAGPPALQMAAEPRYNLRRHKAGSKSVAASVDSERKTDKEVGDATISRDNEITSTLRTEVVSENANSTPLVQVTSSKQIRAQTVSSTRVVRFQTPPDNIDAVKSTENVDLSEEGNGTTEQQDGDEQDSTLIGSEESDRDGRPVQASFRGKLWTFFTT